MRPLLGFGERPKTENAVWPAQSSRTRIRCAGKSDLARCRLSELGFDHLVWSTCRRRQRAIVEKFHAAATKVLATPTMQQRFKQLAINPMLMTPADMDKYVVAELSSNEKLIRAAGIK